MTVSSSLTKELKKLVLELENDLRVRVEDQQSVLEKWKAAHEEALKQELTGNAWQAWRDDRITQVAVAWVLTTVFVRFCEDNHLIDGVWFAGVGERGREATENADAFFRANPTLTDRDWVLNAVQKLRSVPATRDLVGDHSPLHLASPSGDAAGRLIAFWRQTDDDGHLVWDFTDEELSTRFLGDLYQDLSDHAKKTFALLQTPEFVEEFILDQTMEPALAERPLEGFKIIDPTCGSGHFLLGAFARLEQRWAAADPELSGTERAQKALDSVGGVDINPAAVAIARFRLIVAALKTSRLTSLEQAPHFDLNLAAGDSLIWGRDQAMFNDELDGAGLFQERGDEANLLRRLLQPGTYDAVVGNPPYITVKDKKLNKRYRDLYSTCKGKYALSVPFMERFFDLAKHDKVGAPGWVGQITSNSFMKREFGTKLVEEFFPRKDLRLIVDTSGAYIPGHGTPTVIVVGRPTRPSSGVVRAVLGKRGEPGQPEDAAQGLVWTSISENVQLSDFENEFISVTDVERDSMSVHPWSLAGGAAPAASAVLGDAAVGKLSSEVFRIGVFGVLGADDAFMSTDQTVRRKSLEVEAVKPLVTGDLVRDFGVQDVIPVWFPYDREHEPLPISEYPEWARFLWRVRTELGNRATFGGGTYFSEGRHFTAWHQLPKDKGASPLTITFAFVATHNHFVLDRGGKVFNRSAPVVKLPEGATEDEHLQLLGALNSSTACFWLKQNSHNKGSTVDSKGARQTLAPWEDFYEFTGTTLKDFPLPSGLPLDHSRRLDSLARELARVSPANVVSSALPTQDGLDRAYERYSQIRELMIAEQEELDWECYRLYGLTHEDFTYGGQVPRMKLGERAFEIQMARNLGHRDEIAVWLHRHGATLRTEWPQDWPKDFKDLAYRRHVEIQENKLVGLLERPEYKRRWVAEPWEKQVERALRPWLLDRLEDRKYWFDASGRPAIRSVAQVADIAERDTDLRGVLELWTGRKDATVTEMLTKLLAPEGVPFLAAYRLKDSGLRKYTSWLETWDLQRREDAGENVGQVPVPPKYATADFRKVTYWSHRGKLDVPKERFISYPGGSRSTDSTEALGWAGWDHAQQALALAALIGERESDGWGNDALVPLIAGLAELEPWVRQWHNEDDATYGVNLADLITEQLRERCAQVGMSVADLQAWRPPAATRGRKAKR